jgi:hypothetical protein
MKDLFGDDNEELNRDLLSARFDTQNDLASDLVGGTVATVADVGVSMYNSLPYVEEVDTQDVLEKINENAANVYMENTDTIQAMSLLAGSLVGGGLVLKGMNALRNGAKGVNWFSEAGRVNNLKKIEESIAAGIQGEKSFKATRAAMFRNAIANNVVDAAIGEVFVLGTMNAHPLLEDYWDDPAKNFGLSLAFGGILGGGVGAIAENFAIKKAAGAVETAALSTPLKETLPTVTAAPNVANLQVLDANIKAYDNILRPDYKANELTKQYTASLREQTLRDRADILSRVISKDMDTLAPEDKKFVLDLVSADSRFTEVDSVKFLDLKEDAVNAVSTKIKASPLTETTTNLSEETKNYEAVYSTEFKSFVPVEEAANYSRASALGLTPESLDKLPTNNFGLAANVDAELGYGTATSVSLDRDYLVALHSVNKMDEKQLRNLVVAETDLPMLNALKARFAADPDVASKVRIKVTSNRPSYEGYQEAVTKQKAVKPDHFKNLTEAARSDSYNMIGKGSTLPPETKNVLDKWIRQQPEAIAGLRRGIDRVLRSTPHNSDEYTTAAYAMLNSPERRNLQEYLRKNVANAEGKIYLYRGIHGKAVGHSAVESYSPSPYIAKGFSNTNSGNLFEIDVDDVLGVVNDDLNEFEYLVGSQARKPEVGVEIMNANQANKLVTTMKKPGVREASLDDINSLFTSVKEKTISALFNQGMPIEQIAIRTNTPKETVEAFAFGLENGESFSKLAEAGENFPLASYSAASEIPQYLSPKTRPLRVKANPNKLSFSQKMANSDISALNRINSEYIDDVVSSSESNIARLWAQQFVDSVENPNGMNQFAALLRESVAEFTNNRLGNSFISSADHFLRDTTAGKLITTFGKQVSDLATKAGSQLVKPLTETMQLIAPNIDEIIEHNTAINLVASLQGKRFYKNGQFFQLAEDQKTLVAVKLNGQDFTIKSQNVRTLMEKYDTVGKEMLALKNTERKILGQYPLNDIGFWVQPFDPTEKEIAYVWNNITKQPKLIWGNNEAELVNNISAYKATVADDVAKGNIKIVLKGDQNSLSLYDYLDNRFDPITMQIANVEKLHTGASSSVVVSATTDYFSSAIRGLEYAVAASMRRMTEMKFHDTVEALDKISGYNQRFFKDQNFGEVQKTLKAPEDGARKVRNILLGDSNLQKGTTWKKYNDVFEAWTTQGLNAVGTAFKAVSGTVLGKDFDVTKLKEADYEKVAATLKQNGIHNPYEQFDTEAAKMFGVASITEAKNTSKRAIYASNALAATASLRVLDLAQPLVNMLSLPILSHLAKAQYNPATFLGAAKAEGKVPNIAQVMHEGARWSNHVKAADLDKKWEDAGFFTSSVSEANNALRQSRRFEKDAIANVENAVDSSLVNMLSKPADWTESFLRRQSMYTGYALGKHLYPTLDDNGLTIFARDFMDRAIGNYASTQRPVFFQGTAGTALGLFQTYMLTLGQSVYRHLELKSYKEIAKAALIQNTMFGTSSMPGFDMVSTTIGDHYSDDNVDLTTGTFRALNDGVASAMLYGIPSSLGPAVYTRGDIAPRAVPITDPTKIAAVNMIGQTVQTGVNLIKATQRDFPDMPRAIGEALSMQGISRPLARVSELFTGYSVTQTKRTVGTPEEVYTFGGIAARLLGTRPIDEAKIREYDHLSTVYNQLDRGNRQAVTKKLKENIRNNTLDDTKLQEYAYDYMRKGGTPTGWRSALNTAMVESNMNGRDQLAKRLSPQNPINYMIDGMDGE